MQGALELSLGLITTTAAALLATIVPTAPNGASAATIIINLTSSTYVSPSMHTPRSLSGTLWMPYTSSG